MNSLRWTLYGGNILGTEVRKVFGNSGLQPGDIAKIAAHSHHFIVTDIDSNQISTVEGNTEGQAIRTRTRNVSEIIAYYQIQD